MFGFNCLCFVHVIYICKKNQQLGEQINPERFCVLCLCSGKQFSRTRSTMAVFMFAFFSHS